MNSNLKDQMEVLAQGIASSARECKMAVGDSKVQTAMMLKAFGLERMAMAKDLKSRFAADHVSRVADVRTIRTNAGTMCEKFFHDHVRMRRSLGQRLSNSTAAVANSVASLCADFAKGRADSAKAHRHMIKAQRAGLTKDRRDRSRAVVALMNDFHVSRGKMAQALAASLAKSVQETRAEVSGLNGFRASLQKIRDDAWTLQQIPNSVLASETGRPVPAPFSAFASEPEERQKKTGRKKDTGH